MSWWLQRYLAQPFFSFRSSHFFLTSHLPCSLSLSRYCPVYPSLQSRIVSLPHAQGQSHCLLLVEPVLLPNLGHTGVARETLPGDRPLFYPNGKKNCSLGATVRNAVYQSTTTRPAGAAATARQQQHGGATSNSQQLYHNHHSKENERYPQGPPSDWAGSSAYYTLASENSSSCCHDIAPQHAIKQHRFAMYIIH